MSAVTVEGADRLAATLHAAADDLENLQSAHGDVAQLVLDRARSRVPIRSGRLAGSGRPDSTATESVVSFGGGGVRYAVPIHWGTGPRVGLRGPHNIRATRFALSAAEETQPRWENRYLDEIQTILSKVKGA